MQNDRKRARRAAQAVPAQSGVFSPAAALEELMAGNRRFTRGRLTAYQHDLAGLRQKALEKQEPFASILACADSRVPVELLFDQSIGHLFVARVAGNMVTPEIMASMEYGVAVLGTKVILVLGHRGCGAVKAAIEGKAAPGQISALYPHIRPAVEQAGPGADADAVVQANARIHAALLRQASPVLAGAIEQGELRIAAGFYDIGSGKVTLL